MSDYFTYSPLTPNTVARAADVNTRFQSVSAGFDLLPPPAYLRDDRLTYSADTGTVNALVATPAIPITSYTSGLHVVVKAANANTGAVTINVSGLGVKSVKRADGSALQTGDIVVGQILDLTYDGTDFRLSMAFADLSPAGVVAKLQAAGSFSLGTNASLTITGTGQLIAPSITVNSQTLTPTATGAGLVNAANAANARSALGLGTMATETASNYPTNASLTSTLASYALLASPPFTGAPTAPTAAPGTNTTQLATTAFVTDAVASGSGAVADGDKGDINVTGSGLTWTIDPGAVTLAKMANVAQDTVFYRKSVGSGAPETQTLAQLKTDLGLVGNNTGDQTITLTGDVTGTGQGSFAATLGNGVVTFAKMADIATDSLVGRDTAGTGDPEAITVSGGIEFTGAGALRVAAFTGDVTKSAGGTVLSIASSVALGGNPTTTTQAAGNATTRIATTAFVDNLKGLPNNAGGAFTLTIGERGELYQATGDVTCPNSVFAAGDMILVYNNSASDISIVQGSGVTMRLSGTATTGTRTLAQRGIATILYRSASECIISGDVV